MKKEQGFFTTRDQTRIYYEISGQGRPLIFCYGLLCQRAHWRYQLDYFGRHYRTITFDYRGHQHSGNPANDQHLTLEWCAKDVQDLMNYLNLSEAVCLGHSMGVPVSIVTASLEPKRVKGIVLVCGGVTNPFSHMFYTNRLDPVFRFLATAFEFAPEPSLFLWKRLTQKNWFSYFLVSRYGFNPDVAQKDDVLMYIRGVNETPANTFFTILKDYGQFDGSRFLSGLDCPALVIAGEEDYITPIYLQEEMVRLLKNGMLKKIPSGSHNAHLDFPDKVNEEIEHFLKELDYR